MRRKKNKKNEPQVRIPTYAELFEQRFTEQKGRILAVDVAKGRALKAVKEIREKQSFASSLFVVRNVGIAREYAHVFFPEGGARIVSSAEDIRACLGECGLEDGYTDRKLKNAAEDFVRRFPNLIVCFAGTEGSVLHSQLCMSNDLAGNYSVAESTPYCFSDLLAECRYRFSVIDDVYRMLSFEEYDEPNEETFSPLEYDRVVFKGQCYRTPAAYSYRRLLRVADSTESCIVLSNILADKTLLSLYAALSLVHPDFRYMQARDLVKSHASNFSYECEMLYGNLSLAYTDNTVQSLCLQKLDENPQLSPSEITTLYQYFHKQMQHFSMEEVFLRAIYYVAKRQYDGDYASNSAIINRIGDYNMSAYALCDICFSDELKAAFETKEANLTKMRFSLMSKSELATVMGIFRRFGGYALPVAGADSFKIARLYHDESGFEELLRHQKPVGGVCADFDKTERVYATLRHGEDRLYKCAYFKHVMENDGLANPALLVTLEKPDELCERFREFLPGTRFTDEPLDLLGANGADVSVAICHVDRFESMAVELPVKTVVFDTVLFDIEKMDILVKKAQNMGDGIQVRAMASYRDFTGFQADAWEAFIADESRRILPISASDMSKDQKNFYAYQDLVSELTSVNRSLQQLVEGRFDGDLHALADQYRRMIVSYTDKAVAVNENAFSEFSLFKAMAAAYENVFANSVTVCTEGDMAYSVNAVQAFVSKKAQKNPERRRGELFETVSLPQKIRFNVCSRQLNGTCDINAHDCASCNLYRELVRNSFDSFKAGALEFYVMATFLVDKNVNAELKRMKEVLIRGEDYENVREELQRKLKTVQQAAEACRKMLDGIKLDKERDTVYYTDYEPIRKIRDNVRETFSIYFDPYYHSILEIYSSNIQKMKTAFETAAQIATLDGASVNT